MNELQSVTDIDEVIKYTEREAEGCHQMASAYHTDEGVYLQEETRFIYKAILWENIHEWLEELKERRKKQRKHGEWIFNKDGNYECSECGIAWKDMPVKDAKPVFKACPWCGIEMREGDEK